MTEANGWPDPAHPGTPLNPERGGWHLVGLPSAEPVPVRWQPGCARWKFDGAEWGPGRFAAAIYFGPMILLGQLAVVQAVAAELHQVIGVLAEAAGAFDQEPVQRALDSAYALAGGAPIPAETLLPFEVSAAAAIREAKAEERERCAAAVRAVADTDPASLPNAENFVEAIRSLGDPP